MGMETTTNPTHDDSLTIWECPCRECVRLDWLATRDVEDITLREFRRQRAAGER